MLRKEQNDLLTRTGAGTPMGEMFRRYWMPALLAEELPENDCPPVRVQLLSEKLIAFRDTEGRYGLIDEFCAHRGVSLWFGRNEECGLRCPYHGWKYDVTGQCVEIPSEPERERLPRHDQAALLSAGRAWRRAVDLHGAAGASAGAAGIRVRHGAARSRPTHRSGCNTATGCRRWRAASIPATCHGCIAMALRTDPLMVGSRGNQYNMGDAMPVFEVVDQPAGLFIGARRNAEDGILLADHAVVHAVLHHDRAARQSSGARAFLDSDRRRELLGVELRLPSDARADRGRGAGDARRQGHPYAHHSRHLYSGRQPRQRLPDGSRGAEGGRDVQRRRGHRHAGCVAAGEHGADHGPLARTSALDRQRHHHGAAAAAARGAGAGEGRAAAGHRSRDASCALGRGGAAARMRRSPTRRARP